MLIRFSVENFMSFKDEVELSMIAGKQRIHPQHLIVDEKHGNSLLKTAVIYGANASGKSNLIKAMAFAKQQIVEGVRLRQAIPIKPFKLEGITESKPSKFEFEFKYRSRAYNYGFILDARMIYEEWLYEITKTSEKPIFERVSSSNESQINFPNIKFQNKDDKQFLDFVARGTRPNQLFLTESIEKNVTYFRDVYDWFDKVLSLIFPESRPHGFAMEFMANENFKQGFQEFFQVFDTGITGLDFIEFNLDEQNLISPESINEIKEKITLNQDTMYWQLEAPNGRYLVVKDPNNQLKAYKFVTIHKTTEGEVHFESAEESDGTRRLFDLIPALMDLLNSERIIIIDELDRSLHPHLSRKILEVFLSSKSENASQLIVTTHESSLLDLDLLRRDEIWFIEKDKSGVSQVYSLEEFAPRYDKDIRKGYLLGRFGAIPIIQNSSIKDWAK